MNVKVTPPQWNWVELSAGEYELQGEHAYYRVHHNAVTGQYHLGRRLTLGTPIKLVGVYGSLDDAKSAAERKEVSL